MFNLAFKTDNAAFDTIDLTDEVAAVLRRVIKQIEIGADHGVCLDTNGNIIGSWSLELDE